MKPGDILLTTMRQADGSQKLRPVLFLRLMPPFQDFLVCGISTQLQHEVPNLDEQIRPGDRDFVISCLKSASLVRVGYLAVLPRRHFTGRIGSVAPDRLKRLLHRLADVLRPV